MNKVSERCKKQSNAKFYFAAKCMFNEVKYTKILLYFLNVIPVIICFLPSSDEVTKLVCSFVSFGLTLINEVAGGLLSTYKEKAIMTHQLYEASITGSTFSKIEYDRESTNDLNELAIRKGLPRMRKASKLPVSNVPQEINDDYSYLYLCRTSAAKVRFLLSRMFYAYVITIVLIGIAFVAASFAMHDDTPDIYYIVCFWPLIIPILRNAVSCKKCTRYCVKLCADIDNFFADGDNSVERLARFYYYVQNIEFEMMLARPIIFNFTNFFFRRGVNTLTDGVTQRFIDAILELKSNYLIKKGIISAPHGKDLITQKEYDAEYIEHARKRTGKSVLAKKQDEKKEENKNEPAPKEKVRHVVILPPKSARTSKSKK